MKIVIIIIAAIIIYGLIISSTSKKKNEESNPPAREYKAKKIKFKKFSVTGGVVNLYEALKLAENWKKK